MKTFALWPRLPLVALIALVSQTQPARAQATYLLTDLDAQTSANQVIQLNANSVISGTRPFANVWKGYTYSAGVFSPLDAAKNGTSAIAYATNLLGQTAGSYNNGTGYMRGALWQPGALAPIELKPIDRGYNSGARGINARGDVVGFSTVRTSGTNQVFRAVLWRASTPNSATFTAIKLDPDDRSHAISINDYGQVLLTSGNLWQPSVPNGTTGALIPLGIGVRDLSSSGHVCGSRAYTENGITRYVASLWSPVAPHSPTGASIDIGSLAPGWDSTALGVNRHGAVVGISSPDNGLFSTDGVAFLYSGGVLKSLDDPAHFAYVDASDNPVTGWHIYQACGINDSGMIAAYAVNPLGATRVVLLTPRP